MADKSRAVHFSRVGNGKRKRRRRKGEFEASNAWFDNPCDKTVIAEPEPGDGTNH